MNRKSLILALPLIAVITLDGCKRQTGEDDNLAIHQDPVVTSEEFKMVEVNEEQPIRPEVNSVARPVTPKTAATTAPAKRATGRRTPDKAETIYVETEGAQGRVWGHVTMKGDRGTGTIHDWDENTLTVSVTRHGNELFALDQNSRQYVFKLKK